MPSLNRYWCSAAVSGLAAADLNGDGLPDLLAGWSAQHGAIEFDGSLLSYINDSPGDGFLATGVLAASGTAPVGLASIVTAYGINLASITEAAAGPPYPTTLGGIRLHIGDEFAPLVYVSPNQINYLAPLGNPNSVTADHPAISIEHVGQPFQRKGIALPVILDSPGLFAIDRGGVAGASAVRVAPDGSQTPVPVFDCSRVPCTAVPVDTSGDPVYLSVYATGMAYVPLGMDGVLCDAPGILTYFGPQGQYPGLQQLNFRLRPSLTPGVAARAGISCSLSLNTAVGMDYYAFPATSNTVYIAIK